MLATRNPVVCEFMRGFLPSMFDLSVKNALLQSLRYASVHVAHRSDGYS